MKLMLWLTVGALGPVLRDRLCLDWSTADELRYRAHLKVVHQLIRAIPDERQYFPLARKARDHYRATGEVAAIPMPVLDLDRAYTGPLNLENPSQPLADIAKRSGAAR
jgi:hypothetical protein